MDEYLKLTAEITCAYTSHNSVPAKDLPEFIAKIHATLHQIDLARAPSSPRLHSSQAQGALPPVDPQRTVFRDFIISLENGEKYKALRRHLASYGLSPDEYRAKWGLPTDYPMVCEAHSEARSNLAKSLGLGRGNKKSKR